PLLLDETGDRVAPYRPPSPPSPGDRPLGPPSRRRHHPRRAAAARGVQDAGGERQRLGLTGVRLRPWRRPFRAAEKRPGEGAQPCVLPLARSPAAAVLPLCPLPRSARPL